MSVVLRQAHGFEGVLARRKPDGADDSAILNGPDGTQATFHFDPAHFSACALDHDGDNPLLTCINQLLEDVVHCFPRLVPLAEPFQKASLPWTTVPMIAPRSVRDASQTMYGS